MEAKEERYLLDRLIPVPKDISFKNGKDYALRERCRVVIYAADVADVDTQVPALFRQYWRVTPALSVSSDRKQSGLSADAYSIRVREKQLVISAKGLTGLTNALKTLRQLAEVERGTEKVGGYFLVPCDIDDDAAMAFRGVHLCIFPETELWDIEKQIRLAAYHKFNHAVIEVWGVFPFVSHPEFCFRDRRLPLHEFRRLIALGKELGVTLIPQFNILGHASAARGAIGKHAVLDSHPELQPLFEPDGWAWCLTNPNTRRILADLIVELHEFFGNPGFFHIGCDEADHLGTCQACRREKLDALVLDHLLHFHQLLTSRGARVLMWHDMLLDKDDERWKGYIVNGQSEQGLHTLYQKLPRDIVICDWQYHYKEKLAGNEPTWPTVKFFRDEGFATLVCPWLNQDGICSLGQLAAQEKLLGLLETTWHINHRTQYDTIYSVAANAAWNPFGQRLGAGRHDLLLATTQHLRQVMQDMGCSGYERCGFNQLQVNAGVIPYPE